MISFSALAIALAVAQAPAQASPPPAPPAGSGLPVITLDEALRLAKERNLDLMVLRARLDQADEIAWKAWARYLPQVTVTGAWQRQKDIELPFPFAVDPTRSLGVTPGDNLLQTTPIPIQPTTVRQGQLEVTQTIFSLAGIYGIRAARSSGEAAALSLGDGRRALLFGVASAYYGAASLKQTIGVSERLLEIAQRQEKDARVRFQAGTVAKVALLRAEIDRARAEQDLKRARNSFESARLALATLLDRPADFDVVEPPSPPLPDAPDADALLRAALQNRLDVKAARVGVDAARATRNVALGRYLPNVGAFFRGQLQSTAGLTSTSNYQFGLQLQWQILDGGLRESDLREGNAKIAESDAALRSAEAKARQDVVQALLDLDSARANAAKAKEQRDLAAENLRLVDVSYRAGAATAVELADATAALRTAEAGVTSETLGAQLAALRVLQAAGEFEPGKLR
ncbi:MAG TPA: TolC family protein [Anaeromyxobacter sp.]|nr:TolC family protein [Anaeromyxobacter sp.]